MLAPRIRVKTLAAFALALTLPACGGASFGGGSGKAAETAKPAVAGKKPADAEGGDALGQAKPGDPIESEPGDLPPAATDGGDLDPGVAVPTGPEPDCDALTAADVIDFESLAALGEGASVSDQFATSHGVRFSLEGGGSPALVAVEGSEFAWICSSMDCSTRTNGVRPGERLGSFLLSANLATKQSAVPLIISYDQPVAAAGGAVVDVDTGEKWEVQARDASGAVLETVTLLPGGLTGHEFDGRGKRFTFRRPQKDIRSLRLVGTKEALAGGIGLAFDNFSPARACKE